MISTRFLDGGEGRTCAEEGLGASEGCDNCRNPVPTAKPGDSALGLSLGARMVEAKIQSDQVGLERLEKLIGMLGNGEGKLCPVCFVQMGASQVDHTF